MSDDQSRPITQKPNETSPTSRHSIMLLTTSAIGAALLFLSGLTLTGTVISLVIATPVLILFSPILFPTGIIIFLATAGFLFSGSCGVAAAAALAWLYNYIAGKRRRGAVAEQLDYARMRIASRARDMRERAREYGQKVQQNKAQSQEVNQGSESKDGSGGGGDDGVDGGSGGDNGVDGGGSGGGGGNGGDGGGAGDGGGGDS
ncbi:hypothetical protein CsSME_00049310 [Camellia sinensis var. sinensis]|uniref:oleosin 1-like n=1 Tax=Camellia sinensis TaxID=4442 RepID=UPI001036F1E2|nr:oleosin 1-like [Camellia sinensis]